MIILIILSIIGGVVGGRAWGEVSEAVIDLPYLLSQPHLLTYFAFMFFNAAELVQYFLNSS